MYIALGVIVFIIISAVIIVVLLGGKIERNQDVQPRAGTAAGEIVKKSLLTPTEQIFFRLLVSTLPEFYIFPQVAFSALLTHRGKEGYRLRNSFNRLIADFVIVNQNSQVVAIIELDDKTHDKETAREKDQIRDDMLEMAGYRILRYRCENFPDRRKLQEDLT